MCGSEKVSIDKSKTITGLTLKDNVTDLVI